ncbi:Cellulose synthase [Melia azedarach]|uniref:Cellulose synthase n=1 Tax=Melia azedarach TaxID=155640 RepID=A0ACC1WY91_MELAZ|nr:Cellulose synthase [Melia azedarach]
MDVEQYRSNFSFCTVLSCFRLQIAWLLSTMSLFHPRLLHGIPLFPKIYSVWVLPFAYAIFANRAYSLGEFLWAGATLKGWWNDKRMWWFQKNNCFFAFANNILKLFRFTKSAFVITAKGGRGRCISEIRARDHGIWSCFTIVYHSSNSCIAQSVLFLPGTEEGNLGFA